MFNRDQPHRSILRKAPHALGVALIAGVCLPSAPAAAAETGGWVEIAVDSEGCPIIWVRVPIFGRMLLGSVDRFVGDTQPTPPPGFVDTQVEQPTLPPREVYTGKREVWIWTGGSTAEHTWMSNDEIHSRELENPDAVIRDHPPPNWVQPYQATDSQTPTEAPKTAEKPPPKPTETPKTAEKQPSKPADGKAGQPVAPGQWIDETGKVVDLGPDGTLIDLTDPNHAYNVHTHKSYTKDKDGVWKDKDTGKVVPMIPINTKLDPANPKTATHLFTGKKFSQAGSAQTPQQPTKPDEKPAKQEKTAKQDENVKETGDKELDALIAKGAELKQQLIQKMADRELYWEMVKNSPELMDEKKLKQFNVEVLNRQVQLGELNRKIHEAISKQKQRQSSNAEQAKPEDKSKQEKKDASSASPASTIPPLATSGASAPGSSLGGGVASGAPETTPKFTIYVNIKAGEEALRQGKSAPAIPELTLKLGSNPLPIPGSGGQDIETGAGSDPAQGTIRRTGKIDIAWVDRRIYHFPPYGNEFDFNYVPRNERGLIGYTTDGKLTDYQPPAGVELKQSDFRLGQNWARRVSLEFSYGRDYGETFVQGAFVMDPCFEKKPAPPGALPISSSALDNELPGITLRLGSGRSLPAGTGAR